MIIIKINRKLVKITIAVVLLSSVGLNIYSFLQNKELASRYEALVIATYKSDYTNMLSFLASKNVQVQGYKDIEIFDINKGSVIKRVQSNTAIQNEAEKYLAGITGMYPKVIAFPDKGYIIRIPLEPPVAVRNQWLNGMVNEVFIIFPVQEKPYLLILDDKSRPVFYTFEGNTDELLNIVNFKPAPEQ